MYLASGVAESSIGCIVGYLYSSNHCTDFPFLSAVGTGESGKSTITKQMKIIHINGFTKEEKDEKVLQIRKNLRDSILSILGAMNHLDIKLENYENEESVRYLMSYAAAERQDYPEEFYYHTARLWQDAGVQECHGLSYKYQLIDSAKYFLDRISSIRKNDYTPTDQDVLRCRVMTNSIQKMDFEVKDGRANVRFSVYDVGGQQGERRKWISVFDSATAILFVVDCSCFDQVLREDHSKNRLLEAIQIFEQVWNSRFLRYQSIIIFLNKIDLLAEKIMNGKTLDMLIENFIDSYPRGEPGSDQRSRSSISMRSRSSSCAPLLDDEVIRTAVWHAGHSCEFYYTCAVDTHTIKKVLEGCRSVIIKKYLEAWGI
ncbi:hypothetical protein CAPTEDRAFT_109140 [Capitella teleta]|uniref:Guanine nucleotide-binding protein G(s) subunit alpha n=1 Tax=Capitella teleta TaxID=283909 RepID=R7UEA4_CAPTE|nr:hypothetical protein CAPTEDRAFT_109140 [Capitella teleta]|eukprot:ELU02118.1 hypothetical protein CAPTEDRAFT_109140 [Capitella teleta]